MAQTAAQPGLNPVAMLLKTVGRLTAPDTLSGRAFKRWEGLMTGAAGRLATNDLYLNQVGKQMSRSFRMRARTNRLVERYLHTLQLPTARDIDDLRDQVRRMHDQLEALGFQFEAMMSTLEAQRASSPKPASRRQKGE
jgi:hypothetical protein